MISPANKALLERKFGRSLPAGDPKVSLTVSALAKLLDEAREEGAKDPVANPGEASAFERIFGRDAFSTLFGGRA